MARSATSSKVAVVRVYEDSRREAGDHRVLVDRLWPRGVKKEALDLDEWNKDVAPSADLRRWYGHDPDRFAEFERRYRAELCEPPARDQVARLKKLSASSDRLVLLTATRDVDISGATVLESVLRGRHK